MANHLTKDNIDKLTSKHMYSYFERGQEGCKYLEFYSNISGEFEQKYHLYDLPKFSDKILKALCFIYNEKRNRKNNFNEEYCSYLYYWLGHIIYPKVMNKNLFEYIIKMIYDELNTNNTEHIMVCKYSNSSIELDNFIKNKLLFDYSKDYINIRIDTAPGNTTCNRDYKDYLAQYIRIYKDAYSNCNQGNNEKYDCAKFSSILNEKLYKDLSTFNCKESQYAVKSSERPKGAEQNENTQVHHFPPSKARDSSRYQRASGGLDLGGNTDTGVQQGQQIIEQPTMDDTTEVGTSKTIAGSVAPVLGVSSISLLLYKVTPLGGFIRNFLGRNKNMYNPAEYMDSFNPYSDGMVPGDRRMNISYHRL